MNFTHEDRAAMRDVYAAQIGKVVLAKMAAESVKLSRLKSADEEIYIHTTKLMAAYKETISLYERFSTNITSPEVIDIIDGIITVLVSRLREFEEVSGASAGIGRNPITDEKQAIVSAALDRMEEDISACGFGPSGYPKLYESYLEHLNVCRGQLNDLQKRKEVQLYLSLMEDEWEILSTIIKIQVHALEQAVEHAANTLEKIAVHKILSLLREAYQHFGRASTEVTAVFHHLESASDQWQPESFEEFRGFITKHCNFSDNPAAAAIRAEIGREVEASFGRLKMDLFKEVYRFRRLISDEMMLADEMVKIFSKLRADWPLDLFSSDESKSECADIMRGIAETIEIKIEGLRESIGYMTEECNRFMDNFTKQHSPPASQELESAKEAAFQLWMESSNEDSADSFEDTNRRINQEKSLARAAEDLAKKLTKFKREILLYEISTYEEIIFYSVSRLREFEEFSHAVALADHTLDLLEIILKKNNIEVVRPVPHELFNPKEHEVLMAESNPDFKKGEIVKLMNSGYRQKDVILLRANVIAAR